MKTSLSHLDSYREPHPVSGYIKPGDTCGMFRIPHFDWKLARGSLAHFIVMAADGNESGWDHVSAHVRYRKDMQKLMRCPTWAEMCWLKEQFFNDDEAVMQLHPAKADHISMHDNVLHLWRPVNLQIPLPPKIFV